MEALRSLILQDLDWAVIGKGFLVVVLAALLMATLSIRTIRSYD
jgi:ABC-2 type transport system permease protein